jgi:hypothetical protein
MNIHSIDRRRHYVYACQRDAMSAIDDKYAQLGGPRGVLGRPFDAGAGSGEMDTGDRKLRTPPRRAHLGRISPCTSCAWVWGVQ